MINIIFPKFYVGIILLVSSFVLGYQILITYGSEPGPIVHASNDSVELGILELSPLGEAGGYAMPASGCSQIHRDCTGGYQTVCTGAGKGEVCNSVCQGWSARYVNSCTIAAAIDARRNIPPWSYYSGNDRNIRNGQSVQVRWRADTSDGYGERQINCTASGFSRTAGTDSDIGDAPGRFNVPVTEPSIGANRDYRINCTYYNRSASDSLRVTNVSVNGACNNAARNSCSAGSVHDSAYPDTSTEYRWRCNGISGGAHSGMCSIRKPINGVCGVARNTCVTGVPSDGAYADTSTEYRWRCNQQHGGSNSGMCTAAIAIGGACGAQQATNQVTHPTGSNACSVGTYVDTTDSSTRYQWRCDGNSVGSNASCYANIDDNLDPDNVQISVDNGAWTTLVDNTRIVETSRISLRSYLRNRGPGASQTFRYRFWFDTPTSGPFNFGGIWDAEPAIPGNDGRWYERDEDWLLNRGTGSYQVQGQTENSGTWTQYSQDTDAFANDDDTDLITFIVTPPAPTNPRRTCSADGTSVTLEWDAPAGYTNFYIRMRNDTTGGIDVNWNENYVGTSVTLPITPNHQYDWWVHARDTAGVFGPDIGENNFTCVPQVHDVTLTAPTFNSQNPSGNTYYVGATYDLESTVSSSGNLDSDRYRLEFECDRETSPGTWVDDGCAWNDNQPELLSPESDTITNTWSPSTAGTYRIRGRILNNGTWNQYNADTDLSNNQTSYVEFTVADRACDDRLDNDNDGLFDTSDPDCPPGGEGDPLVDPPECCGDDTPVSAEIEVCFLGDTGGASCIDGNDPNPFAIVGTDEIEISWDSDNAQYCSFAGSGFNGNGLTGGSSRSGTDESVATPNNSSRTYTVTCFDADDASRTASADVVVSHNATGSNTACVPAYSVTANPRVVRSNETTQLRYTNYSESAGCDLYQGTTIVDSSPVRSCGNPSFHTSSPLTSTAVFSVQCVGDPTPNPTKCDGAGDSSYRR